MSTDWINAGLDRLQNKVKKIVTKSEDTKIVFSVTGRLQADKIESGFNYEQNFTVYPEGTIKADTKLTPFGKLPSLPRVGLKMKFKKGFDQFTWYGGGPHESYIDRNQSAKIGLWSGSVDAQYVPYVVPQEFGNKTNVRWAKVTNKNGKGLKVISNWPFETSVHHFGLMNLSEATHTSELVKIDETNWYIDFQQDGLGGNSCGPGPLKKYLLQPNPIEFSFIFKIDEK